MIAIIGAVLLTAVALAVNAWLVTTDRALELLTPAPEQVVHNVVAAVSAHRPESAATHLAAPLRNDAEGWLARLDAELRRRHGDYRFEDADATRQGDSAEVRARLRSPDGDVASRRFMLARDPSTRLWKITAFPS